ncbi:carcinoembryonic antigen-related cell adhesion molecule 5-like, partial [Clarias magur]
KPKPKLTSSPEGDVLTGNSVTLTCTLNVPFSGWKFYWDKNGQHHKTGPDTHTYTISPDSVSDRDQYRCYAGRGNPEYTTYPSNDLQLKVIEKPTPELTSDLKGDVLTGNSVTLYCTLTPQSTGWKFYWYKNGQHYKTGPDTHTYTISSLSESHRGRYRCRAGRGSPEYTTHDSNELPLEVIAKPQPKLTSSLEGDVLTGNSVTLICTLNVPSTGWTFHWIKNRHHKTEPDTHTYTISPVSVSDRGRYMCYAGRGNPEYYTHASNDLQLKVI